MRWTMTITLDTDATNYDAVASALRFALDGINAGDLRPGTEGRHITHSPRVVLDYTVTEASPNKIAGQIPAGWRSTATPELTPDYLTGRRDEESKPVECYDCGDEIDGEGHEVDNEVGQMVRVCDSCHNLVDAPAGNTWTHGCDSSSNDILDD